MSNMSYCRFQNTATDVQDCMDAINGDELSEMSNSEQQSFVDFIMNCKDIAEQFEDMDEWEIRDFIKEKNNQ